MHWESTLSLTKFYATWSWSPKQDLWAKIVNNEFSFEAHSHAGKLHTFGRKAKRWSNWRYPIEENAKNPSKIKGKTDANGRSW